jgi:hypothetical protein
MALKCGIIRTGEGELSVAGFLVNFFKGCGVSLWLVGLRGTYLTAKLTVNPSPKSAVTPHPPRKPLPKLPLHLPSSSKSHLFVSSIIIMAPHLDAARRILIQTPENPRETAIRNAYPRSSPRRPPKLHCIIYAKRPMQYANQISRHV